MLGRAKSGEWKRAEPLRCPCRHSGRSTGNQYLLALDWRWRQRLHREAAGVDQGAGQVQDVKVLEGILGTSMIIQQGHLSLCPQCI